MQLSHPVTGTSSLCMRRAFVLENGGLLQLAPQLTV